jgi:hypothetical protein
MLCAVDVDRKNRERRRAAYKHASKVHERAAKTESDVAEPVDGRRLFPDLNDQ